MFFGRAVEEALLFFEVLDLTAGGGGGGGGIFSFPFLPVLTGRTEATGGSSLSLSEEEGALTAAWGGGLICEFAT